jgi:hypothetical protein
MLDINFYSNFNKLKKNVKMMFEKNKQLFTKIHRRY